MAGSSHAARSDFCGLATSKQLLVSKALVVDACRHVVCDSGKVISLETRPVLFALARALAEAWPGDVPRALLLARAFRAKHVDESHRARLRVEIGRLRKALGAAAGIDARKAGFALAPRRATSLFLRHRRMKRMRPCSLRWWTAKHGRVRPWHWRSAVFLACSDCNFAFGRRGRHRRRDDI
jgi:hypothetical protein